MHIKDKISTEPNRKKNSTNKLKSLSFLFFQDRFKGSEFGGVFLDIYHKFIWPSQSAYDWTSPSLKKSEAEVHQLNRRCRTVNAFVERSQSLMKTWRRSSSEGFSLVHLPLSPVHTCIKHNAAVAVQLLFGVTAPCWSSWNHKHLIVADFTVKSKKEMPTFLTFLPPAKQHSEAPQTEHSVFSVKSLMQHTTMVVYRAVFVTKTVESIQALQSPAAAPPFVQTCSVHLCSGLFSSLVITLASSSTARTTQCPCLFVKMQN